MGRSIIGDAFRSFVNPVSGWLNQNIDSRIPADAYSHISDPVTNYAFDKAQQQR
jgi:hypothetical protein